MEVVEKKKVLVPKLRFNDFNEKPWSQSLLNNLVEKVGSGSTPSGGVQVYKKEGIPFIRSQNVSDDKLTLDETHIEQSVHEKMKGSKVLPFDILLNITGASIGRSCVVPFDFAEGNVNQHVCIIRLKSDYDPKFFQSILACDKGQKLIYQGQTGSGREGLNFQSIRLFKFAFPTLPEQQKIAAFLSSVDEKIQQLGRKKKLLDQYKKGVMQQLFSGKLRFKDENGNNYPDWEEKRLGEVIQEYKANSTVENEHPVLTSSNRGLMLQSEYYGENRLTGRSSVGFNIIPKNFLTYRSRSDDRKFTFNLNKFDFSGVISTYYPVFEMINGDNRFLVTYLNFHQRYFGKLSVGTSQTVLSMNEVKKSKLKFPYPAEQQKIANYLSNIDKKIEQVTQQITQTQTFKKGLLQQMFV